MGRWFKRGESPPQPMPPIAFSRLVGELLSARLDGRPFDQVEDLTIASGDLVFGLDALYEEYRCDIGALQETVDEWIETVSGSLVEAGSGPILIPLIRTLETALDSKVAFRPLAGGLAVCLGDEHEESIDGPKAYQLRGHDMNSAAFDVSFQMGMTELRARFPKTEAEAAGSGSSLLLQIGAGEGWESSLVLLREFRAWARKQLGGPAYYAIPRTGSVLVFGERGLESGPRSAMREWATGDDSLSDQVFWESSGGLCAEPL